jgi:HK97 family phage major capsid protein
MLTEDKLAKDLAEVQSKARAIAEQEERSEAAEANLKDLLADGQKIKARADELAAINAMTHTRNSLAAVQTREAQPDVPQSWGEMFTRSDQFGDYRGRGTSGRVNIETRALPMSLSTSAPSISKQKIVLENVEGPAPLLGLIPVVTVSSNGFDVVVWSKSAGGAAVVPEGTAKPPAEWAPVSNPITLDTVAVHTQMTRQLIEDEPAVRSKIDTELQREVLRALEASAAAQLVAATLPTVAGATLLESIRMGVGTVQAAGFSPSAVLLNPADWATLDITVMGSTLIGPSVGSQFWGLRPVASVAQPAGTATVGDFSAGVERYSRSGVSLYITDSHASTFLSNVFTLLAETRSKTVVTRPAALCECTKSGATTAAAPAGAKK